MPKKHGRAAAAALLVSLSLGACGTPDSVREGARLSAAQIAVLDSELRNFMAREKREQEYRKAQILDSMADDARVRERIDARVVTASDSELYRVMTTYAERSAARRAQRLSAERELEAWLAGLTDDLQGPTPAIKTLQTKLAELGAERDFPGLAEFYVDYAKQSYDFYRDLEKEAEKDDGDAAESD